MSMILIRKSLEKHRRVENVAAIPEWRREETGVNHLLVEKRLNQLRPRRDVGFGRGQEGAC